MEEQIRKLSALVHACDYNMDGVTIRPLPKSEGWSLVLLNHSNGFDSLAAPTIDEAIEALLERYRSQLDKRIGKAVKDLAELQQAREAGQ